MSSAPERLGLFGPAHLSQYTCPPDGVHPSLNTLEEVCRQAGASHVAAAQYSSLPLAAASCPMRKSSVMPPCRHPLSCTASPVRVPLLPFVTKRCCSSAGSRPKSHLAPHTAAHFSGAVDSSMVPFNTQLRRRAVDKHRCLPCRCCATGRSLSHVLSHAAAAQPCRRPSGLPLAVLKLLLTPRTGAVNSSASCLSPHN